MPTASLYSVASIADLASLGSGNPGDILYVRGFRKFGDGGGGLFFWPDDPLPDDGVLNFGGWRRDWNGDDILLPWCGAIANDISAAAQAANDAAMSAAMHVITPVLTKYGQLPIGPTIRMPHGVFSFSKTIRIDRRITLRGSASGTTLSFPPGIDGLWVYRHAGAPDGNNDPNSGEFSTIEQLMIQSYSPSSTGVGHGLLINGRAFVRTVFVDGFSGDGICVQGSLGTSGTSASFTQIDNARITNCTNGFHVAIGEDSSACTFRNVDVADCRQWGIFDEGFLGNQYIGCGVHNSGMDDYSKFGAYKTTGGVATHTFFGCYVEGSPLVSIVPPALVFGGNLAIYQSVHGIRGNLSGPIAMPSMRAENKDVNGNGAFGAIGSVDGRPGAALSFGHVDKGVFNQIWQFLRGARVGEMDLTLDGSYIGNVLTLFGEGSVLWEDGYPELAKLAFQHGVNIGSIGSGLLRVSAFNAMPTWPSTKLGVDVVINSAATKSGDTLGWYALQGSAWTSFGLVP